MDVCCGHLRNQEILSPFSKMAQLPQNTIVTCDQNSETLQSWHKPKHCPRNKDGIPYPSVKSRSTFENFVTTNAYSPHTVENHLNSSNTFIYIVA
jgi:hypothetical protein